MRAEGVEPSRAVKLNGFSYRLRLSPPGRGVLNRASGLRSGLSLHRPPSDPGLRCCPSDAKLVPLGTAGKSVEQNRPEPLRRESSGL